MTDLASEIQAIGDQYEATAETLFQIIDDLLATVESKNREIADLRSALLKAMTR